MLNIRREGKIMFSEDRLKEIVLDGAELKVGLESINSDTDLISILLYDSLAIVDLIVTLEGEFGIEFDDTDLCIDTFTKFGKLRDTVKSKL